MISTSRSEAMLRATSNDMTVVNLVVSIRIVIFSAGIESPLSIEK